MKLKVVRPETAIKLKEVGFDAKTEKAYFTATKNSVYWDIKAGKTECRPGFKKDYNSVSDTFWEIQSAPTQSLVQMWLRENNKIYLAALPYREEGYSDNLCWYYSLVEDSEESFDILCNEIDMCASVDNYDTHDEAIEAGILEAIKQIKTEL